MLRGPCLCAGLLVIAPGLLKIGTQGEEEDGGLHCESFQRIRGGDSKNLLSVIECLVV